MDDEVRRIGPFRLLERIGEGGMGTVWLAERRSPVEQRVALKVIRTDRLDKTYRARFAMEQQALARMDHPAIARLFDAGEADGQSWYAMEHVPGQTLADYCLTRRLRIEDRLRLFLQVCDGVQHAHQRGILHRDLKPGNILVREIDGRPHAKIIDFGLAQPVDPLQIRATLHEAAHSIVGTLAYMSPEQADRVEGDLDVRTDVYSLGVVLYELLTGELPIGLEELRRNGLLQVGAILREHSPKKPSTRLSQLGERLAVVAAERSVPVARLCARVRGDLDVVAMRAIAPDRRQRYESVRDFARDIERVLAHRPVEARAPSAGYLLRKWVRRHWRGVAVAAAVLVGSILVLGREVVHGNERRQMAAEAALDLGPFVGAGLIEQAESIGLAAESASAIEIWRARVTALLATESDHRMRARDTHPERAAESQRFVAETLPQLQNLEARLAALQARITRVRAAMVEHEDAWQRCIAEIVADRRYGIAAMPAQFGLLPLGRDPRSKLFEFRAVDTADGQAEREETSGELRLDVDSEIVVVLVPGGDFQMGTVAGSDERFPDPSTAAERPVRVVHVSPFFIGKFEVTSSAFGPPDQDPSYYEPGTFAQVQRAAGGAADTRITRLVRERGLPVANVNWLEASTWSRRLGFRLPTEAEWEYSARAGSLGAWPFPASRGEAIGWANLADAACVAAGVPCAETDAGWLQGRDGAAAVAPVGAFPPNAFGLHDMHGNVQEWCQDQYRDYDPDAAQSREGSKRVVRGGSYSSTVASSRSAARRQASQYLQARDIGFRVARDIRGVEYR